MESMLLNMFCIGLTVGVFGGGVIIAIAAFILATNSLPPGGRGIFIKRLLRLPPDWEAPKIKVPPKPEFPKHPPGHWSDLFGPGP